MNGFGKGVLGGSNVGVDGGVMDVHGCSIVHSGVTWGGGSIMAGGSAVWRKTMDSAYQCDPGPWRFPMKRKCSVYLRPHISR